VAVRSHVPDRVVDAVPTAALAAAVLVALEVSGGQTTTPVGAAGSFALHAVVVLVGVVAFEAAWDRVLGDD
jgi:hypothetical protein